MKVYYRKKFLIELKSVEELEKFIIENNIYKHFKKFQTEQKNEIKNKIIEKEIINFKEIKPWIKKILNYPDSIYNFDFLHKMGWDEKEIYEFIEKLQKNNSNKLKEKKEKFPDLFFSSTTSRIEYWLNKGYNLDEAKNKLKERQQTFSKEKCINKHGYEKGIKIFYHRQKKWIETLKNKSDFYEIQKNKNSFNYCDNNYEKIIKHSSFLEKTKNIILHNLNSENIFEFVNNILKEIEVKRYSDILPYINSTIIQKKFNVDKSLIKKIFFEKTFYCITKQTYGIPVYHNGIRFKSIKEYLIALHLEQKGIKYFYEKNYPNSILKYDFYLPEHKIYIEYYGMLDNKNFEKLNKIQLNYKNKMELKNTFCHEKKLTLLSDINYENLINKINKIV